MDKAKVETIFRIADLVIEMAPRIKEALVKHDSEVRVQTPSELSNDMPSGDSDAANVAVNEYRNSFIDLLLSAFGSSVATDANALQAIKNDETLYRLVSNTELPSAGTAVVASQVLSQGMLIQISFQLAELQAAVADLQTTVEEIKTDLFEDYISSLDGSSTAVSDAIGAKDKTLVATSISAARRDFKRLRNAIEQKIPQVVSRPTLVSNWRTKSVQSVAEKACSQIEKGLKCLLNSMRCVATGYSIIDQQTGQKVASDLIREINSLPLEKLQDDLRALPYQKWRGFEEALQNTRDAMPQLLAAQEKQPVFILSGHEIHSLIEGAANG